MKVDEIKLLFDYNDWADARILKACARVSPEQYAAPTSYGHGGLRAGWRPGRQRPRGLAGFEAVSGRVRVWTRVAIGRDILPLGSGGRGFSGPLFNGSVLGTGDAHHQDGRQNQRCR